MLLRYHGLRRCASPVSPATGFVNGRCQFSTPHTPLPITKNLVQVISSADPTAVPKFGANPSMGASGQIGEIKRLFLFFYFSFSGIHLQVRPVDGLLRLMAQTTP